MKITTTILSIPPYISTTWKNIASLHAHPNHSQYTLAVILHNQIQIEVPNLEKEIVDEIFKMHARFAEEEATPFEGTLTFPFLKGDFSPESLFSHNANQSDFSAFPPEILNQMTKLTKLFGITDLPKPEENCNCSFCQISRALHEGENSEEPPVSEEDLKFKDWEVIQKGDSLYEVISPLNSAEHYQVYLGSPLGCTCGEKNCEHIRAVLNS